MKNKLLERITRRLAPPARFVALLLAVCAAGGAMADNSLEETGGFVTATTSDTAQLVFKDAALSDLTADTLAGRFGGGWSGNVKTHALTFNNFDRSNEGSGSITCQAQVYDDTDANYKYLKGVFLTFVQNAADVYVYMTAAKYQQNGTLGDSLSSAVDARDNPSDEWQYSVYNLRLPRTPDTGATVVWEKGEFGIAKVGSDGNEYSIVLPASGITADTGYLVVGSDATTGATIDITAASTASASIFVKYVNLYGVTTKSVALASAKSETYTVGARTSSNGGFSLTGYYDASSLNTYAFGTTPTMPQGAGYLLFSYCATYESASTCAYAGRTPATLSGGATSSLRWSSGVTKINTLSVGGPVDATSVSAWAGAVIEKVAIFVGSKYTNTDEAITGFEFPTKNRWDSNETYAWRGNGNTFHDSTLAVVDSYGELLGTTIAPNITLDTSSNGRHWDKFCNATGKTYKAPGCALFYDSTGYTASSSADFAPLTLGGLYVTSPQTSGESPVYYSITGTTTGARTTELGDPTGNEEMYFVFDESFSISRVGNSNTGNTKLYGLINMYVADGKTFDLNSAVSNNGGTSVLTAGSNSSTPGLKMSGEGTFAVKVLKAEAALLDYSDLAAEPTAAFISGTLVVDDDTTFAFPENAVFPYPVATAITDNTTNGGGNSYTVGGVAGTGTLVLYSDGYVDVATEVTYSTSGETVSWTSSMSGTYIVNVTEDTTINIGEGTTLSGVIFNISSGKFLSLTGNTLTASKKLVLTGEGAIWTQTPAILGGTLTGDGTIIYNQNLPNTSSITLNNSAWEGTVWIENKTGITNFDPTVYGSAKSTIKMAGIGLYFINADKTYDGTLEVTDTFSAGTAASYGLSIDNGYSANTTTFAKLTGDGTIKDGASAGAGMLFWFKDPSGFSGSVQSDYGKRFRFGPGNGSVNNGQILVTANTTINIPDGETWSSSTTAGITVNGTLNNNGTITVSNGSLGVYGTLVNSGTASAKSLYASGTVTATAQITATSLTVGASSTVTGSFYGGGSGALTVNKTTAGATFTGYINVTLGDGVTQSDLGYALTSLTLNGSATYSTTVGNEGQVTFASGATGTLTLDATAAQVNYEGYTPSISGTDGTVAYTCTADGSVTITSAGNVLLPYYTTWTPAAEATSGSFSDTGRWPNGAVPNDTSSETTVNVAFKVPSDVDSMTITIDATHEYGEAQVYGGGIGEFIASGSSQMTVADLSVVNGTTLVLGESSGVSATTIYVEDGSTLKLTGGSWASEFTGYGSIVIPADAAATLTGSIGATLSVTVEASGTLTVNDGTIAAPVTNNGAIIASGDTSTFSGNNVFNYGSTFTVSSGTAFVNAADQGLKGKIVVATGATFSNTRSADAMNYSATTDTPTEVEVHGTLSLGSTRWSLRNGDKNKIMLHEGGVISGAGTDDGALDWIESEAGKVSVDGNAEVSARMRIREGATATFDVAADKTLTISTQGTMNYAGSIAKTGDGILSVASTATFSHTGTITVSEGQMIMVALPTQKVSISADATFTLKNCEWTGTDDVFGGAGTLELYSETAPSNKSGYTHTATGSTFGGTLKLSNSGTVQNNLNPASAATFDSSVRPELIANASQIHLGNGYYNNLEHPLAIRNLSGESTGDLRGVWGTGTFNYLIETMQEKDTVYAGLFTAGESGGNRYINLSVIGDGQGAINALTISKAQNNSDNAACKASTLTVSDESKVVFASAGSWGYGTIVVGEDGYLESSSSATTLAATLTLQDGATVVRGSQPVTATALTALDANATITVAFADGVTPSDGMEILNGTWATQPDAARFAFADATISGFEFSVSSVGVAIVSSGTTVTVDGTSITVPNEWLASAFQASASVDATIAATYANDIEGYLTSEGLNGMPRAVSYLLGLSNPDEASTAFVMTAASAAAGGESNENLVLTFYGKTYTTALATVTYSLKGGNDPASLSAVSSGVSVNGNVVTLTVTPSDTLYKYYAVEMTVVPK